MGRESLLLGRHLETLVAACEAAFVGDAPHDWDDDEDVSTPPTGITFGMIRKARAELDTARFAVGDRVRVSDRCSWEARRGALGTVTATAREYGTVHVKLDDEDVAFADGGTASFDVESLERLAGMTS